MTHPGVQGNIVSSPRFTIEGVHVGNMAFSELSGINSELTAAEHIINDPDPTKPPIVTKNFGTPKPPTVSLKRPLDGNAAKIFAWHKASKQGDQDTRDNVTFTITDPGGQTKLVYTLENAWCSKIQVPTAKAGDGAVPLLEVTIQCEDIIPA